jgi:hypothetical protein
LQQRKIIFWAIGFRLSFGGGPGCTLVVLAKKASSYRFHPAAIGQRMAILHDYLLLFPFQLKF